jgi:two-component system chemotaxis sensor kinase CheA
MPQNNALLLQLRSTFMVEAREHVQAMSDGLLRLEKTQEPRAQGVIVDSVFRAAHSLKGAARAVELAEIEGLCQSLEDIFAAWRRTAVSSRPGMMDALYRALDTIGAMLATLATAPAAVLPDTSAVRRDLRRLGAPALQTAPFPTMAAAAVQTAAPTPAPAPAQDPKPVASPSPAPSLTAAAAATADDTVRIALAKLESHLMEAEELLSAKLAAGQRVAELRELAGWCETWRRGWAEVQVSTPLLRQAQAAATSEPTSATTSAAPARTLEIARILEFCDRSGETVKAIESRIAAIGRAARQDHDVLGKRVDDVLENAKNLLTLPFAAISASFSRLVRDLCRDQGKQADLIIHGEQVEMDRHILEAMKDPLVHMLRNAVDHAVEPPAVRARRGKPASATITLTVTQIDGNKIQFVLADDGAGIDGQRLRTAAAKRGLLTHEEAMRLDEAAALDLVFQPDISTSEMVTQLSGRGLGLAIVREKAQSLGGTATVTSAPETGTMFRIVLPAARAASRGILFKATDQLLLLPTALVDRVARIRPADIHTVEGRTTVFLAGRTIALVRLADALELHGRQATDPETGIEVIIVAGAAGNDAVAFIVDELLGEQEVLVKPLRKPLIRVRNIAAAAVLASGEIVPVLNPADLLKSARRVATREPRPATAPPAPAARRSVLVAEDSITSRMLLKTILESAGYAVATAVDGMEAFALLRAQPFDLLVSDVQMPRLDGFSLTARIRADAKLAELPVVLVTALATREDRERGIDVGANAYIVKSSFDQEDLVEAVGRLI